MVAGFLVYDFFFIPPYLTLLVGRLAELGRAGRLRRRDAPGRPDVVAGLNAARARERRQGGRSGSCSSCPACCVEDKPLDELLSVIVTTRGRRVRARQVALFLPSDGRLEVAAAAATRSPMRSCAGCCPSPGELARARRPSGFRGDVLVHALTAAGRPVGLLVLSGDVAAGPEREPLLLFANQIALAVERAQLREQALRTRVTEEMARLAKTLVAAVSHDLRAPLASIKASSSTLADAELDISPARPARAWPRSSTARPTGWPSWCRTCST